MKMESSPGQHLARLLKRTLESSKDIESAAPALLEAIAKRFDCQWGTYWKVDFDRRVLRPIAMWNDKATALSPLVVHTRTRVFTLNEGVAGQVWKSGKPICTSDLIRDMCLPRSLSAKTAELSGGIWFPVRADQTTYGVIELLAKHSWPKSQQLIDELASVGDFIGASLPERRKP